MLRTQTERRWHLPPGLCAMALAAVVLAVGGCRLGEPAPPAPVVPELTEQQQARFSTAEAQLESPDAAVRRQAAVALLSMDYPPAFSAVLRAMTESPDAAVRISMIQAAAFCVERRCFEAILDSISYPDPEVRRAAANALTHFTHPEEIDSVVALISRPDTTVEQRCLLFRALGEALAIRAVPVLLNGLEARDQETRLAAYEALTKISRRDLPLDVTQWQEWWASNAHRTREDILSEHRQALEREVDACRERLSVLTEEKQELTRLIVSAGSETPQTLLAALASRYDSVRLYASVRLAALDPQVVAGLKLDERDLNVVRNSLDDASPEVRRNVVRFVVAMSGSYREELVRKALSDDDPGVLTAAILATRSSTGPEAAARIAELLTKCRDASVRTEAAIALGKVGTQESIPALLAALDDTEENVRWFAVEGLRKLGAVQAVPRISKLLESDDSERVRQIAAGALGELGQPDGAIALSEALSDRNEKVRETAAASLLDLATDDPDRMAVIADKLRRHGMPDRARDVLNRIVEHFGKDPEAAAQVAAAYKTLAQIEEEQGNLAAAADAYEKLDAFAGGSVDARRELVRCWIEGGEGARVEPAVKGWLAASDAAGRAAILELAVDAAERLTDAGGNKDAAAVLDLVEGAGGVGQQPQG
jgi:HEAT repeat protein